MYKIKKIILENMAELPVSMKIHLVVNVSRITMYLEQVERQKKILSFLVEIDEKKEYEIDKILSRQDMGKKLKYLVI